MAIILHQNLATSKAQFVVHSVNEFRVKQWVLFIYKDQTTDIGKKIKLLDTVQATLERAKTFAAPMDLKLTTSSERKRAP